MSKAKIYTTYRALQIVLIVYGIKLTILCYITKQQYTRKHLPDTKPCEWCTELERCKREIFTDFGYLACFCLGVFSLWEIGGRKTIHKNEVAVFLR